MAGTLFDGFHAFFQLQHFRFEDAVALHQALVLALLLGDLLLQVLDLRQAAVAHPEAILQASQQQDQDNEQPVSVRASHFAREYPCEKGSLRCPFTIPDRIASLPCGG
ncbi:hypothetical protein D9M70_273870 [compost metagenome]